MLEPSPPSPQQQPLNRKARRKLKKQAKKNRGASEMQLPQGDPRFARAMELSKQEKFDDALAIYTEILKGDPNSAEANFQVGHIFYRAGDPDNAYVYLKKAVELSPKSFVAWCKFGYCLMQLDQNVAATIAFQNALEIEPNEPVAHLQLGITSLLTSDHATATTAIDRAIELKPDWTLAHIKKGYLLQTLGDFEAARAAFWRAIELDPKETEAYFELTRSELPDAEAESIVVALDPLIRSGGLAENSAAVAHFAIAGISHKQKDYDRAFTHYRQANDVLHEQLAFDREQFSTLIDDLIAAFTPELFAARRDFALSSELPVFIVGMPRSGSTLTEQILSSHSEVSAAGELVEFNRIAYTLVENRTEALRYPNDIAELDGTSSRRTRKSLSRDLERRPTPGCPAPLGQTALQFRPSGPDRPDLPCSAHHALPARSYGYLPLLLFSAL